MGFEPVTFDTQSKGRLIGFIVWVFVLGTGIIAGLVTAFLIGSILSAAFLFILWIKYRSSCDEKRFVLSQDDFEFWDGNNLVFKDKWDNVTIVGSYKSVSWGYSNPFDIPLFNFTWDGSKILEIITRQQQYTVTNFQLHRKDLIELYQTINRFVLPRYPDIRIRDLLGWLSKDK